MRGDYVTEVKAYWTSAPTAAKLTISSSWRRPSTRGAPGGWP